MNKKTLLAGACALAFSSSALMAADEPGFNFSVGAEGGFAGGQAELSKTIGADLNTVDLGTQGAGGGVMLSVGYLFEGGFALALEGSGMWYSTDAKVTQSNGRLGNVKVEMKDNYNIMGCFGYKVADCVIPFLRMGVAFSKWESSDTSFATTGKRDKYLTGFVGGLGVDFMLSKNIALGFVYDHAWYNDMSYKNYNGSTDIGNSKVKPEINTFKARVRFVF